MGAAGQVSGNNRNGTHPKTVLTDAGAVPIAVPRDRNEDLRTVASPRRERRLTGFNELVTDLVARGMTVRDVQAQLEEAYGVEVSPSRSAG